MIESPIHNISEFILEESQILLLEPKSRDTLSLNDLASFQDKFSALGFELIYLPQVFQNLEKDIIDYYLPDNDLSLSYELAQNRIVGELGILLDSPLAIRQVDGKLFAIQSNEQDESSEVFLELLVKYLEKESTSTFFSKGTVCYDCAFPDATYDECKMSSPCSSLPEERGEEYDIEQLILELQELKESRLRELGLSESALRFLLGKQTPTYSRMVISRHAKIYLPDYGNKEIKMDDKTKALYFLFLKHPEGLAIKDLPEHKKELMDLYQSISGRDDPNAMKQTIDNLADPFQNNANISLSRIKKAFAEAFSGTIAKAYYVSGERGGRRSISLDRSLVVWEAIR